jgi:hypothetical protein
MVATTGIATSSARAGARHGAAAFVRGLAPLALTALIGAEAAAIVAWMPDTLSRWDGPVGDFRNLFGPAHDRALPGLYSPFVVVLLQPLVPLGELGAYRAFFVLNCLSSVCLAFVAQRYVEAPIARASVALGVLSLPQLHWAIRLGHLTPLLTLALVCGLSLLERRTARAPLALAALSLKPQYALAPFVQMLRDGRPRDATRMLAAAAAMALMGFAVIGFGEIGHYVDLAFDWGGDSSDNLLPAQQSWLVSWPGVQISFGYDPRPPVTFALIALSLGVTLLAWAGTDARTRACVTAFAALLLTPYAQFYDAALIVAGVVLFLRCDFAAASKVIVCCGLYLAALITQANTIFPVRDVLGPGGAEGPFWLTPALLLTLAYIAIAGKRTPAAEAAHGV